MKKVFLTLGVLCAISVSNAQPPDRVTVPAANPNNSPAQRVRLERIAQRKTPQGTLTQFLEALNDKNFSIASECVFGAKWEADLVELHRWFRRNPTRFVWELAAEPPWPAPQGETFQITRAVHQRDEMQTRITWRDNISFALENDQWKIVPREETAVFGQLEKLPDANGNSFFCEHMATLIAHPKLVMLRQRAQVSMQRQKGLILGVFQLVLDNGEQFAFTPDNFRNRVKKYIDDEDDLDAPREGETDERPYRFNPNLFGKKLADIAEVARTVMVYDGQNEQLDFRFNNYAIVGFADGHVELVNEERAKTLIWKP